MAFPPFCVRACLCMCVYMHACVYTCSEIRGRRGHPTPSLFHVFASLLWVFSESGLFTVGKYPAISHVPQESAGLNPRVSLGLEHQCIASAEGDAFVSLALSRHWATSAFHSLSWHQRRSLLVGAPGALRSHTSPVCHRACFSGFC